MKRIFWDAALPPLDNVSPEFTIPDNIIGVTESPVNENLTDLIILLVTLLLLASILVIAVVQHKRAKDSTDCTTASPKKYR